MKYDDSEYYFLEFTTDLPTEYGGRHMALFLDWAVRRGLASAPLMQHAEALRRGDIAALDLLFDACDGKLTPEDLNDEGNAFAEAYYARHHVQAYTAVMGCGPQASADEVFAREPSPAECARMYGVMDRHYSQWIRKSALLPRQVLLERAMAKIQPVAEQAGFPRITPSLTGSDIVCASFQRATRTGTLNCNLIVEDSEWFYGIQVVLTVFDQPLQRAIYAEKQQDLGGISQIQHAATIPLARLAQGWTGPLQVQDAYRAGFWVFWGRDIDPLLDWLAARLGSFALPTLHGLEDVASLAHAYATTPIFASPIHHPTDPYPALVALEQARHPQLGAQLDAHQRAVLALEPRARSVNQRGALALIERMRARNPP